MSLGNPFYLGQLPFQPNPLDDVFAKEKNIVQMQLFAYRVNEKTKAYQLWEAKLITLKRLEEMVIEIEEVTGCTATV